MCVPEDPERRWRSGEGTWITWRNVAVPSALGIVALIFNSVFGFWHVLLFLLVLYVAVEIVMQIRQRRSR
jgi:hypothetical protein